MNGLVDYKKKIAIKYKTEICKNWEAGFCEFGDKCVFAHGRMEIREKSYYKTKRCRQFFESGYCMFGNKCLFQHLEGYPSSVELDDNQNSIITSNQCENSNKSSAYKPRLPVFQQICQNNQD